ncbi:hypothetical protein Hydth_0543 [Hydrogenobacter thermophilus TK-6]|uniref:F5/8 type C domain-containing protein n=1 Tax=Hydrogenobacter thermophilus (strain DSM 6534 / IAM 12695 / TK-6) TaxID=608538 RepID=D3DGQ5_HYDTT|nr:hypothetical protein [Hydrogenobacter thermophilus]ADO44943.1 hypothetical protein Hydth_0543 [Hydrogenobacter thermophilus TK-6]BAI69007.1 hypothetical protein HTH_0545 [Hydrogenobacter thermophilus TK-6]
MPITGLSSSTLKTRFFNILAGGNATDLENFLSQFTSAYDKLVLNSEIFSNPAVMDAVVNSPQLATVFNSTTALNMFFASSVAITQLGRSYNGIQTLAQNAQAMRSAIQSQELLNLISRNPSFRQIFTSSTAIPSKSVPTMTSNTTPEGQALGSSIYSSSNDFYKAFDKNSTTLWEPATPNPSEWVGYMFSVPVFVHTLSYTNIENINLCVVQRSSDGTSWEDILTFSPALRLATPVQLPLPLLVNYYKYYRILTVSTSGYPLIRELDFSGFTQ